MRVLQQLYWLIVAMHNSSYWELALAFSFKEILGILVSLVLSVI